MVILYVPRARSTNLQAGSSELVIAKYLGHWAMRSCPIGNISIIYSWVQLNWRWLEAWPRSHGVLVQSERRLKPCVLMRLPPRDSIPRVWTLYLILKIWCRGVLLNQHMLRFIRITWRSSVVIGSNAALSTSTVGWQNIPACMIMRMWLFQLVATESTCLWLILAVRTYRKKIIYIY